MGDWLFLSGFHSRRVKKSVQENLKVENEVQSEVDPARCLIGSGVYSLF